MITGFNEIIIKKANYLFVPIVGWWRGKDQSLGAMSPKKSIFFMPSIAIDTIFLDEKESVANSNVHFKRLFQEQMISVVV